MDNDERIRRIVEAGLGRYDELQNASTPEEAARIYRESLENIEKVKRGEDIVTKPKEGIIVPEKLAIKVLTDSLARRLGEQARTKFPAFYSYWEMSGEDVDNSTVKSLRKEYSQIEDLIKEGLELGILQDSGYVPVRAFEGKGSLSPHAPVMVRALIRPSVEYDARSTLIEMVNDSLAMCDEAISRNCGFGKYSRER